MIQSSNQNKIFSIPVLVAAFGYMIDIYDLTVFGILRNPSLKAIGVAESELPHIAAYINNIQLTGVILGGIFFGILGDKLGRRNVLFSSILIFSITNVLCGFVSTVNQYVLLRFIAGFGLAAELGISLTIVSEILPKDKRSFATSIVTGVGLLGVGLATLTEILVNWRITYFVGGALGLLLLILRIKVFDSSIFLELKSNSSIKRGNFFEILSNKNNLLVKYLCCILVAVPIYYFYGMFGFFADVTAKAIGVLGIVKPGPAITWYYLGLAIGDLFSGPLSHLLKSRKKIIIIMILATILITTLLIFFSSGIGVNGYYTLCFIGGITTGYWAMFMLMTSEQFPTQLRATATTSAPNLVRGSLILMTLFFQFFSKSHNTSNVILLLGVIVFALSFLAIYILKETFNKDLNFVK